MRTDPALEEYFRDAASWDADRVSQAARSTRIAWGVAGAGWLCAVATAIAIVFLTPLKTVAPYVIRVDNTTGIVDVVPEYTGTADVSETVTRYLLRHYVEICERFTWATAESDYEECGSFNSPRRNQQWSAAWAASNPASPLNVFKDGTVVQARVTSISFFKRANGLSDLAQVRYIKAQRAADGAEEHVTHWIATLQYAYVAPSKDARARQWNPLGFRIVDFRTEAEAPPEVSPTPAKSPSAERSSS